MLIHKGSIPILEEPTAIIPGIFDGLHLGHQKLIKRGVSSCKKNGLSPCIFTFTPHPMSSSYILLERERNRILEELKIKHLVIARFDKIKNLSPSQFIGLLLERLKMKEIWCGADYGFGKDREGNVEHLKVLGKKNGFSVFVIPDVSLFNKRISTSLIKSLLLEGKIKEANSLLGRPYSISGIVIPSKGRGRKLDFPTANISLNKGLFLPKQGVYFVNVKIGENLFKGIANLGTRPTFNEKSLVLEVHILDFKGDIYGKEITVFFYQFLRDEMKFASKEDLSLQIKGDIENAYLFFDYCTRIGNITKDIP